jgi:hypothetical protein
MPQNDVVVIPKAGEVSLNPAPQPSDTCEFFGVPLHENLHRKSWVEVINTTQSMENKIECGDGGIGCWRLEKGVIFWCCGWARSLSRKLSSRPSRPSLTEAKRVRGDFRDL